MFGVEDVVVPGGGEDGGDDGFADFAAVAFAVAGEEVGEGADFFDADEVEEGLSAEREMFAEGLYSLAVRESGSPCEKRQKKRQHTCCPRTLSARYS